MCTQPDSLPLHKEFVSPPFRSSESGFVYSVQRRRLLRKASFSNVLRPRGNAKPALLDLSSLKSIFGKLRFRDGLMWMEGLTGELKLRFQIPPA